MSLQPFVGTWEGTRSGGDVLNYEMGMATTQAPDGAVHLTARPMRR